jgi:hypothetical protein
MVIYYFYREKVFRKIQCKSIFVLLGRKEELKEQSEYRLELVKFHQKNRVLTLKYYKLIINTLINWIISHCRRCIKQMPLYKKYRLSKDVNQDIFKLEREALTMWRLEMYFRFVKRLKKKYKVGFYDDCLPELG